MCLWDSWELKNLTLWRTGQPEKTLFLENMSVKNAPLVNPKRMVLPPIHVKLGLMKNFVKALGKSGEGLLYLRRKFPYLADAEVEHVSLQIRLSYV